MSRAVPIDPITRERALNDYLGGANAADVAKRYDIPVKLLYSWKSQAKLKPTADDAATAKRVKHLEQQLRYKDDEIMVLRELLKKTYQVMPTSGK
jgi:transposase-like protein